MEELPLVTAIVTTCARPVSVVRRALVSVAEQTWKKLEIFLVNDAPENRTLAGELEKLCAEYETVTYLEMPRNSGANAARNFGAKRARGEYLAFLDDDDQWAPKKLALQLTAITPEAAIVYGNTQILMEETGKTRLRFQNPMPEGNLYPELFRCNLIGSTSFPLIRRSVFDAVGGFDETVPALQDLELWLRIAKNHPVRYVPEVLGTYHFHRGDRISAHPENRIAGFQKIFALHRDFLDAHKTAKADFFILGVTLYVNARNFREAWRLWQQAVRLRPGAVRVNAYTFFKIIIRFFLPAGIV